MRSIAAEHPPHVMPTFSSYRCVGVAFSTISELKNN
jgi:hypothetical protein